MASGASVVLALGTACVGPGTLAPTDGGQLQPSVLPSVGASLAPGVVPSGAPVPSVVPSAAEAGSELLLGSLRDEEGAAIEGGTVTVRSETNPELNQTLRAQGGSYVLRGLRVGTRLSLEATAPGYGVRTREWIVARTEDDADEPANRVDFGGLDQGMWYFLSKHFEIARVEPANQAKGVAANPLSIRFWFSQALEEESLSVFANLLRVRIKGALDSDPSTDADETLRVNTNYREMRARFEWASDRKSGTFQFGAPLVVGRTESTTVTVGFDQQAALDRWPRSDSGAVLGWQVVDNARDHTHTPGRRAIAPFVGIKPNEAILSERPTAAKLWAGTHHTQAVFSLKPDQTGSRVLDARFYAGLAGTADSLEVRFDKPVCGFPESALDGEVLRASHYRFVLGKVEERRDREAFEASDPRKSGNSPIAKGRYHGRATDRVIFELPVGFLRDYTHFKLFVEPGVTDLNGNPLAVPEGQLLQGVI